MIIVRNKNNKNKKLFLFLELCCALCYFRNLHAGHKVIEITDEESLKKENIAIEISKDEFNQVYEKVNLLKESIENEIVKINNLYDKIFSEITKSFELKHEKLLKQENEIKEELQNKVTKTKEQLENFLTESIELIRISDKINKGIKSFEKEQNKNMIKVLSYVSKMNTNKKDSNSILVTLMKNIDMNFQEDECNIKYEEYFFNGFEKPNNIQIKDIKPDSVKVYCDIESINNNIDKNKLKYLLNIRNKTKEEKFKQIKEIKQKEFLINKLDKNSDYEIKIDTIYDNLIGSTVYKSFKTENLIIDSIILSESKREKEFLEKIYEWIGKAKYELLYRGSRDGSTSDIFHAKCDDKGPTLVLYKNNIGNIFGGYSSISWKNDGGTQFAKDSFIFTLTNIFNIEPTKFFDKNTNKNVHHKLDYGPSFGENNSDISIFDNYLQKDSESRFPEQYNDTTSKGKSIFTGDINTDNRNFKIKEIEVFKVC